jgi:esterase/lipase superfamily enzyme
MAKNEDKSALLFIHGYNNSFADAARRSAQIACDLPFKGATGFFSWPSACQTTAYIGDEACARSAIPYLAEFIKELCSIPDIHKIHIIAHSMGNLLLTTTLENLMGDACLDKI